MAGTTRKKVKRQHRARAVGGAFALCVAAAIVAAPPAIAQTTVSALAGETHFHGLSVAPGEPPRLYLATHHGLFLVEADGAARRISAHADDLMGFAPHPTDPARFYASGHPAAGGNLGVVASNDAGRRWRKLAEGVAGPVDFHQMAVSRADPRVIYGVHGGLQASADEGRSWRRIGPAPDGLIALAAGRRSADMLYAATRTGLRRSTDGGRRWEPVHPGGAPVTAVHVTAAGELLAYVVGTGLVRAAESDGALSWRRAGSGPPGGYLLHIAPLPDGRTIYAVAFDAQTRRQAVMVSDDGGAGWRPLGGAP